MIVAKTIPDLRQARSRFGPIAFVPTMGALHAGHLSLIQTARRYARDVVVSIFVNPTQFGPREDLTRYPRPLEEDLDLCRQAGVELVFVPDAGEIYRVGSPNVVVDLPELTQTLEGRHRPGHFQGVCQVVAKLFNIVQPQYACFGTKDFQQLRVIEAMTEALDFPIQIVPCPTVREPDGLAMSSRNRHLSDDERSRALNINRALFAADAEARAGAQVTSKLVATMQRMLLNVGRLGHVPMSIDYVACVDPKTLKLVDTLTAPVTCAIAARVGSTRLIDNLTITPGR
ncbi:MAG: pantoate--beta-alanine ligase [Burkholderiales bacterium]|nr:pantoate--beta-alanine ligase [Phycisphaerae bacterium]